MKATKYYKDTGEGFLIKTVKHIINKELIIAAIILEIQFDKEKRLTKKSILNRLQKDLYWYGLNYLENVDESIGNEDDYNELLGIATLKGPILFPTFFTNYLENTESIIEPEKEELSFIQILEGPHKRLVEAIEWGSSDAELLQSMKDELFEKTGFRYP